MAETEKCPDCGVMPGGEHHEDCDVARCAVTGDQRLICRYMADEDDDHECGGDIWTGQWPGEIAITA